MRRAGSRPGVLLLSLALVVGCSPSSATPSPSGSSLASPNPTTPTGTPPAVPSASPEPVALAKGSLAVTVSRDLRVRSEPRVSDDSAMYEPLLPIGTELLVLGGPVTASGYDWYHVSPTAVTLADGVRDGWVAAADHDGTPWIALAEAPLPGIELAKASVERASADPAAATRTASAVNAFGLDLYHRLLGDRNLVLSPASIALALAMARAGAGGDTASQMDDVLHQGGWDALGTGLNALEQALTSRDASWRDGEGQAHELALRIANAGFAQRGWPIAPAYLDRVAEAFGAGLELVDYIADHEAARKAINGWVSRQTAGRIPELLAPLQITEATRLVLVNAIYLKAVWELPFDESATEAAPFTRLDGSDVAVPTMSLLGDQRLPYARGDGWQATELRYLGGADRYGNDGPTPLAMTLIRPHDLAAFEDGLTSSRLGAVTAALEAERDHLQEVTHGSEPEDCGTYPYALRLYLPRFRIETGPADLVPALEALGMADAIDPQTADFSGITTQDRLFISQVIHQANIDVDEKGTEASAATAVIMDTGGCTGPLPAKEVTLRLDRPFLFALRDVETGAVLFMGRVVDPSVR